MDVRDLVRWRTATQLLTGPGAVSPRDAVAHLLALQAQEYAGSTWSIAQRTRGSTDAEVDRALDDATLVRTHVLRPTWHLVTAADLRWLLDLTGPRVIGHNRSRYRQVGLDDAVLQTGCEALAAALRGGRAVPRSEARQILEDAGTEPDGQRLPYLLMHAELTGVVCSGPRSGNQHTYALVDDRAPRTPSRDRDAAVTELVRRYLQGHGPASDADLRWWASLTLTDIRGALEELQDTLEHRDVEGVRYWWAEPTSRRAGGTRVHLLPTYDELFVGFQATRGMEVGAGRSSGRLGVPTGVVVSDGVPAGRWKRTLRRDVVLVEVWMDPDHARGAGPHLAEAAHAYARFVERAHELVIHRL
ncbi:MAG: winged helix DNA-binding domain-containing protein [Actinobacteria bacterium]|nr:winged helix DNA-binding domain-containing protein [Actinomycetota bacterium]